LANEANISMKLETNQPNIRVWTPQAYHRYTQRTIILKTLRFYNLNTNETIKDNIITQY